MKCAEAKRLIAFTREGELGPDEERNLGVHLRTCPACAAEREAFLKQDQSLQKLRSIVPELRDPEGSARAILERTRVEAFGQHQGALSALTDRLIRALEVPGLRYALAVFVTVVVTGFVLNQFTILRSVSALEARLSQPEPPRIRLAYAVNPAVIEQLARSREVQAMLEHAGDGRELGRERIRAGSITDLLNAPESRWVFRTFLPGTRQGEIDSLVNELTRNARLVLTYSKGDAAQ